MKYPGFVGPSYQSQSAFADSEDLINWYVARMESKSAKSRESLFPTPGFELLLNEPAAAGRGIFAESDKLFTVIGGNIYEVFSDFSSTLRGAVPQDAHPAFCTTNGDGGGELLVISGGQVNILDLTSHVLTAFPTVPALMGGMLDGYFMALDPLTSKLRVSGLLDGLTWDPLQFAQRTSASDPWRAMLVAGQRVWLHGERTSEVWYNAGNFPFPLAPIQGAVIPDGIAAAFSTNEYQGSVMWLSQNKDGDRRVVRASGYSSADAVSTHAVEDALATYATVADAESVVYQLEGHAFYTLNFPSANASWTYDEQGNWHKRGAWNAAMMRFDTWRPRAHAFAFGKHLVVDRVGGGLYGMNSRLGLEIGGGPLRRVRRAPALFTENQLRRYPCFELALDTGIGVVVGQGSDPLVAMRKSQNGGKTWGNERVRHAGKMGEYGHRVRWNRCGSGRNVSFEVVVSDPVPWHITDAFLRQPGEAA